MTDIDQKRRKAEEIDRIVKQNHWDYGNPNHLRTYVRHCSLEWERKEKAKSESVGLPDIGIKLTPEEERDLRTYAAKWAVSFDNIAEGIAATYIVVEDRTDTKNFTSLVEHNVLPRNLLADFIRRRIYMRGMRQKE